MNACKEKQRSNLRMWELDCKQSRMLNNWCFRTVVLEKALESPLDCKEIKAVNPKGNQPLIFIGRIDAEVKVLILWPPDVKSWLIGKDPNVGKDWRPKEKGETENETVWWHHWLSRHEFEQTPGNGEGRGAWCAAVLGIAKSQSQLSTEKQHLFPTDMKVLLFLTLRSPIQYLGQEWNIHSPVVFLGLTITFFYSSLTFSIFSFLLGKGGYCLKWNWQLSVINE